MLSGMSGLHTCAIVCWRSSHADNRGMCGQDRLGATGQSSSSALWFICVLLAACLTTEFMIDLDA